MFFRRKNTVFIQFSKGSLTPERLRSIWTDMNMNLSKSEFMLSSLQAQALTWLQLWAMSQEPQALSAKLSHFSLMRG